MPIVNKDAITGKREIPCKVCGNYLDYVYSETIYTCSSCGRQYDPREILGDIGDRTNKQNQKILKNKPKPKIVTRRDRVKNKFGGMLDDMANLDPDAVMAELAEELEKEKDEKST